MRRAPHCWRSRGPQPGLPKTPMSRKLLILAGVAILLAAAGIFSSHESRLQSVPAAAWQCLREPQEMVLYSIHPEEDPASIPAGAQFFHGYRILGQVSLPTATDRQRVSEAIRLAVLSHFDQASCFDPRHALRVSDGRNSYDLLMSYECGNLEIFVGDELVAETGIGGSSRALDSILRAANVPLAKPGVED
jgi:hypothetical protein